MIYFKIYHFIIKLFFFEIEKLPRPKIENKHKMIKLLWKRYKGPSTGILVSCNSNNLKTITTESIFISIFTFRSKLG